MEGACISQHSAFEVDVDLSSSGGLNVSVIKEKTGWVVQRVKPGPIESWNHLHPNKAVCLGDRIISANGTPLSPGMRVNDCAVQGKVSLSVMNGRRLLVDGREGVVTWDAGLPNSDFVKVRWTDAEDNGDTGLVWSDGTWIPIRASIVNAFIGEPAVVDLSCKRLGDEGAEQVASILASVPVKRLCLNYNKICDRGAERLADAIDKSDVQQVDLFGNYFNVELRNRIDEALFARSRKVIVLTVHGVREGPFVSLSFTSWSGDQIFPSMTMPPSATVRHLRTQLEMQFEPFQKNTCHVQHPYAPWQMARSRCIKLVLPPPDSRILDDAQSVEQVLSS